MELINDLYPAYADCLPNEKPIDWIMCFTERLYDPVRMEGWQKKGIPFSSVDPQTFCLTAFTNSMYYTAPLLPAFAAKKNSTLRDYFETAGILNSRPKDSLTADAFAVSMKGGHNADSHAHNDIGTFVVATPHGNVPLLLDPGKEIYTARSFSAQRYDGKAISSFGHPVPMIDNQLQRTGRDAAAKVVETNFSEEADHIAYDLTSAYDKIDGVKEVQRKFTYTRLPMCELLVEDHFTATRAMPYGTAILTYDHWKATATGRLIIYNETDALEVRIGVAGATFSIKPELIEEDMGYGQKPTRLGINLNSPVAQAVVTLHIKRIDRDAAGISKP